MKWMLLPLLLVSCAAARTPSPGLRLEFGDGLCSGTAVGRTTILTASHCLEGAPLSAVNDVETHAVRIVRDGHDHALVTVDRVVGDGRRIRTDTPKVGEAVHWTGQPNGMRDVYREGYIASVDAERAYVDATGYYGDSGSGVWDTHGCLVGVVSAGLHVERPGGLEMQLIALYRLNFTADDWKAVQ